MNSVMDQVVYGLLAAGTVTLLLTRQRALPAMLLMACLSLALLNGRVTPAGVISIAATGAVLWLSVHGQGRALRVAGHILFISLAALLMLHALPGFDNYPVWQGHRVTPDAVPYSLYLNLDKPWGGVWVAALLLTRVQPASPFPLRQVCLNMLACGLLLLGMAWLTGYVAWQPKWPDGLLLWALNNLLVVCFAEEALFRGYLQGQLDSWLGNVRYGEYLAIGLAALAFGLAHFQGGWTYVLLATVAGCFYGYAYYRSRRLVVAMLTHFTLNSLHILGFTYPALAG